MSLSKMFRLRHTLAFRLTFWYWGIFTVSSFGAFLACYVLGTSGVSEYRDRSLLRELVEFSSLLASKGMDDVEAAIVHETESGGVSDMFIRVISPKGDLLASSDTSSWGNIGIDETALARIRSGATHVFKTSPIWSYEQDARILYGSIGTDKILQIGESLMSRKKPVKEIESILYTFAEAQEFLRVSHQTMYNLIREGLPSHKIGSKRMFLKEDLLKWIRDH